MLTDIFQDTSTILFTAGAFLIAVFWIAKSEKRKLPPGPYGLPMLGYLPFLTDRPYLKLLELKQKYGPVYSLKLGSRFVLVLCDFDSIKEAFNQEVFSGKPHDLAFDYRKETKRLEAISGYPWKEQRRFIHHIMRDLGFGSVRMEPHIREEIVELLERLSNEAGRPINVSPMLAPSMSNNISSLVFGKRRHFSDPKRQMMDKILREFGRLRNQTAWHSFFPWMTSVIKFLGLGRYKSLSMSLESMHEYIDEEIEEHKKTLDTNNIRDFMDGYLLEIEKRKHDSNSTFKRPVLSDWTRGLFTAGSNTVRVTMDWLLLISAAFPQLQNRVHKEIDDTLGKDLLPSMDDRKNMPYTQAVIMELMRWRTIAPINIIRLALEDTELNGYFIPRNTYVIANLWAVHHDPKLWGEDVEEFKPERFLTRDGQDVQKYEYFIPFSTGKRPCPGKALAVMETFMYFVSILQKFKVKFPEGAVANFEGNFVLALQPKPYMLILELR